MKISTRSNLPKTLHESNNNFPPDFAMLHRRLAREFFGRAFIRQDRTRNTAKIAAEHHLHFD